MQKNQNTEGRCGGFLLQIMCFSVFTHIQNRTPIVFDATTCRMRLCFLFFICNVDHINPLIYTLEWPFLGCKKRLTSRFLWLTLQIRLYILHYHPTKLQNLVFSFTFCLIWSFFTSVWLHTRFRLATFVSKLKAAFALSREKSTSFFQLPEPLQSLLFVSQKIYFMSLN